MTRRPAKVKNDASLLASITAAGGEVLGVTNPHEVMRFKTKYGVGVVYENAKGVRTWNEQARAARDHIQSHKPGSLAAVVVHGRRKGAGTVNLLLQRDGEGCFFCGELLRDDITVEHLVSVAHGGPNHISNLFLAHCECNQRAGHLSAPEKIRMRENWQRPAQREAIG